MYTDVIVAGAEHIPLFCGGQSLFSLLKTEGRKQTHFELYTVMRFKPICQVRDH